MFLSWSNVNACWGGDGGLPARPAAVDLDEDAMAGRMRRRDDSETPPPPRAFPLLPGGVVRGGVFVVRYRRSF